MNGLGGDCISHIGSRPEFMVRVKLPSSGAFPGTPSGDTEYEQAYRKAILSELPQGFEVQWPRSNEKWPVDSEGYTWVRLRCSDEKNALAYFIKEHGYLKDKLEKVKRFMGEIL